MQPESNVAFERRSKARFPVRLGIRYRTISNGPALTGAGWTVNMSSCGLLIASHQAHYQATIRTGARLQVTVDWPFLLHGTTPLQLIVSCRVIRCQPEQFAVKMEQYQFKTKKR
jgi:hypothetical protein